MPRVALERHPKSGTNCMPSGVLILNADDWGRDIANTDRAMQCIQKKVISSVSAMVFMADAQRAAILAQEHEIDCGLHLNLTTPFSEPHCPPQLKEHQGRISRFLRAHRLAPVLFHPKLIKSFDYVVQSQIDEFERLYGMPVRRIDGHHHMHLAANVIHQKLLPAGTIIRRNFTFSTGEKGALNRWYRARQDASLTRRHVMADFFYSLPPLEPRSRLQQIFQLAMHAQVEVETHPVNDAEYQFLTGEEFAQCLGFQEVARGYHLHIPLAESIA